MERRNAIALTLARPQLTPYQLHVLYEAAGSATAIVENHTHLRDILPDPEINVDNLFPKLEDALLRADHEMDFCEKHDIQVLTPQDEAYPTRFQNCDDAPIAIYYRGTSNLNATHVISIIGTRKCTPYGADLIASFVKELKKTNPETIIVSGLAYGVDVNAHRAALECGMDTIGVLAHGLDMIYPSPHREIAKRMLMHGGLLTEYPSHTRIDKRNFLQRNRIVAALCDACIIPESASHGGGLVTCRMAHDYGRNVFAFPGPVGAEYSVGCNNLIRTKGAELMTSARDFIEDMGWKNESILRDARANGIERSMFVALSPDEQKVLNLLKEKGDLIIDQITNMAQISLSEASSILFSLEMQGMLRMLPGAKYHYVAF